MTGRIVFLPVEAIKPNPWNPNFMLDGERDQLRSYMRANGPAKTPPIIVRRKGDFYEIIDGEQRWLAARELGWSEMPAVVVDVSDEEAKMLTLSYNYLRGKFNYVKAARRIRDEGDFDLLVAIGKTFGNDIAEIVEGLTRMPSEILTALEDAMLRGEGIELRELKPIIKSGNPELNLRILVEGKKNIEGAAYQHARGANLLNEVIKKDREVADWRERKMENILRRLEQKKKAEEEKKAGKEEEEKGRIVVLTREEAKGLLEMPEKEVLKDICEIEPAAEAAVYYSCEVCGSVHALVYAHGKLEAYLVKKYVGKDREVMSYARCEKEETKSLLVKCPKCALRMRVDLETNEVEPEGGGSEGQVHLGQS